MFGDPPLGLGSEDFRDFFMGWGGGKGGAVNPAINPGFLIIEAWRLSGVRSNIPIGTLVGSWFILAKWAAKMPPLPPPRFAWAEPDKPKQNFIGLFYFFFTKARIGNEKYPYPDVRLNALISY